MELLARMAGRVCGIRLLRSRCHSSNRQGREITQALLYLSEDIDAMPALRAWPLLTLMGFQDIRAFRQFPCPLMARPSKVRLTPLGHCLCYHDGLRAYLPEPAGVTRAVRAWAGEWIFQK